MTATSFNLSACTLTQLQRTLEGATAHYTDKEKTMIIIPNVSNPLVPIGALIGRIRFLKEQSPNDPALINLETTIAKLDAVGYAQFKTANCCWWFPCCCDSYPFELPLERSLGRSRPS